MAELNHTIVWCSDKRRSADFLTGILGPPPARPFLHFLVVELANGVSLDYFQKDGAVVAAALRLPCQRCGVRRRDSRGSRIRASTYWADPGRSRPNEINHAFRRARGLFRRPRRSSAGANHQALRRRVGDLAAARRQHGFREGSPRFRRMVEEQRRLDQFQLDDLKRAVVADHDVHARVGGRRRRCGEGRFG